MSREMKDSGIEWIGKIPVEWSITPLKHCSDIIMGQSPDSSEIKENGTTFFMQGNREFGKHFPNPTIYCDTCSKHSRVGDILMSVRAPVGSINMSDKVYGIGRGLCSIQVKDVDQQFLKFYLMKSVGDLNFYSNGSTFDAITTETLREFMITIPPRKEQRQIADFLNDKCTEIDSVLTRTRASIDEYKKLKQAVITEAVTKGVRGKRPMKDSGIEWIGSIPEDWQVFRVANLYREASDKGNDELPILTVSINSGVSDRELSDEESERVFVRSEDRSKYKRVQPGDLVYNMMRAWQGAFGAVRVDGMVSPAYVVARPMQQLDSRYVEYLFRTPEAIEEMHRYSYGVADFRLRLYWPQFRNIRMCVPSYEEQVEIADYIDSKVQEILALIKKKEQYLVELENYKKSLIYEYVTGKKEVPPIA